jgi:hypothetical protein
MKGGLIKIECVITCVNYADFLSHTLPENLNHLDRLVVVTHPLDKATQALCTKYGVDCIETEVMHEEGDKFNKGRMINLGLSHLRHEGWLLHIDADIVLPHRLKAMLRYAKLNEKYLYGADRLNSFSYEHWINHKDKTIPQHQWRCLVSAPAEFSMGTRLLHQEYGYCPLGAFQLWHSSVNRKYPIFSGSAEHSDVLFAVQWSREQRVLLPEIFIYHLESEPTKMGANWSGRTTKHFGPTKNLDKIVFPKGESSQKYCK